MNGPRIDLLVRSPRDDTASELASHVVVRTRAAIGELAPRYEGARVHRGAVVFGAKHPGVHVWVWCGPDSRSGDLAIRIAANDDRPGKAASLALVGTIGAGLFSSVLVAPGAAGIAIGGVAGAAIGLPVAWGVFRNQSRAESMSAARTRILRETIERYRNAITVACEQLGLRAWEAPARLCWHDVPRGIEPDAVVARDGVDEALLRGDERAWSALMARTVGGFVD